jgi:hypothetical protein
MWEMGRLRKAWFCAELVLVLYVLYSVVTDSFGRASAMAMTIAFGGQALESGVRRRRGKGHDGGLPTDGELSTKLFGSLRRNS